MFVKQDLQKNTAFVKANLVNYSPVVPLPYYIHAHETLTYLFALSQDDERLLRRYISELDRLHHYTLQFTLTVNKLCTCINSCKGNVFTFLKHLVATNQRLVSSGAPWLTGQI